MTYKDELARRSRAVDRIEAVLDRIAGAKSAASALGAAEAAVWSLAVMEDDPEKVADRLEARYPATADEEAA